VPGAPVSKSARAGRTASTVRSDSSASREAPSHGRANAAVRRPFSTLPRGSHSATGTLWSGSVGECDEPRASPERTVRCEGAGDTIGMRQFRSGQRVAVALRASSAASCGAATRLSTGGVPVELSTRRGAREFAEIPPAFTCTTATASVARSVVRAAIATRSSASLRCGRRPAATAGCSRRHDRRGPRDRPGSARHASAQRGAREPAARSQHDAEAGPRRIASGISASSRRVEQARRRVFSQTGSTSCERKLERRSTTRSARQPGVAPPSDPWSPAVVPMLGLERRGAKLYRPAHGRVGARAEAAAASRRPSARAGQGRGREHSARFLEEQGRLGGSADGYEGRPRRKSQARRRARPTSARRPADASPLRTTARRWDGDGAAAGSRVSTPTAGPVHRRRAVAAAVGHCRNGNAGEVAELIERLHRRVEKAGTSTDPRSSTIRRSSSTTTPSKETRVAPMRARAHR